MKEAGNDKSKTVEVTGKIIFDSNGNSTGIAIKGDGAGSQDYAKPDEKIVLVIKPEKKDNE